MTRHHDESPLARAAVAYAERFGWPVFPVTPRSKTPLTRHGYKDATTDLDQIKQWWDDHPEANIGLACDKAGFAVADVDTRGGGHDTLDALEAEHGNLPATVEALTSDGGRHLYFHANGAERLPGVLGDGIELKHHGYVILPPSVHPSGHVYTWELSSRPGEVEVAELPGWVAAFDKTPDGTKQPIPDKLTQGMRHKALVRLAGAMRRQGAGYEEILAALTVTNRTRCDPPHTSVKLEEIARDIEGRYEPKPPPVDQAITVPLETTWAPVDMSLVGSTVEEATIFTRLDDVGLIYPRRVHWFQGESESHKTWVLLIAMTQILLDGGNVAYIDFEDHPASIKARLKALGVSEEILTDPDRFVYMRPDEPLGDDQRADLFAALDATKPVLVVIDGVSEAMNVEDLDPSSTPDTAEWIRRLPKLVAATGPGVAVIDHQTKAIEGRKGWAFGSQHKKAGTDGAAYDVTAIRKVHRAYLNDPVEGLVVVKVVKDRVGYVRGHSPGDNAATVKITAWPDGGVTYQITTDAIAGDFGIRRRIAQYLDGAPGASKRSIRDVGGKGELLDQALAGMIADGYVRMERQGAAHAHYLTEDGRVAYLGEQE